MSADYLCLTSFRLSGFFRPLDDGWFSVFLEDDATVHDLHDPSGPTEFNPQRLLCPAGKKMGLTQQADLPVGAAAAEPRSLK